MNIAIDKQDAGKKIPEVIAGNDRVTKTPLIKDQAESLELRCKVQQRRLIQLEQENLRLTLQRDKMRNTLKSQIKVIDALKIKSTDKSETAININEVPPLDASEFLPIVDEPITPSRRQRYTAMLCEMIGKRA